MKYWKLKLTIAMALMGLGLFFLLYLLAQISSGIWQIIGVFGVAIFWLFFLIDFGGTIGLLEDYWRRKDENNEEDKEKKE